MGTPRLMAADAPYALRHASSLLLFAVWLSFPQMAANAAHVLRMFDQMVKKAQQF
jgi:hypothetical protein